MSAAAKRLDEIDARLKAATPGPWHWGNGYTACPGDEPYAVLCAGDGVAATSFEGLSDGDAELIAHAPADLALLSRLVRSVAEEICERCGRGLHVWQEATTRQHADCDGLVCRVRRGLAKEER